MKKPGKTGQFRIDGMYFLIFNAFFFKTMANYATRLLNPYRKAISSPATIRIR
jgi:hypothetical protein